MLIPQTDAPQPGGSGGEGPSGGLFSTHSSTLSTSSTPPPLGCNCGSGYEESEGGIMTDTLLTVLCQDNVTCTALNVAPGATIVSPILLSLSGVTGQIWALYYLYTTTRPQHSRTVFFVLLSTLIWTDLVGKIITTTPALIAYTHGMWVGGVPLCNFHGFSMMLISLVTHLLVSTMAVERFIGIRHGYFYNKNITTSRTKLLLLCIWLFSVLFCALPLFGVGQYALQYPGSWCFVNIHVGPSSPLIHRIYTNVFGLFTLVNLVIMVVCNIVVITTLLCLRLCRQRCSGSHFCAPHRSYKQRELEMQMVIVLLVITIVFLISWSPIDMRLFLNQIWPHTTQKDHIQDLIAVRLTSINQIVDPWAYIICRKVFTTKAWRWMRLSLMGSRLLARESSSHPGGSNKKGSRTYRPQDNKIQYRTPFKGGDDEAGGEVNREVVVVVEGDALLSSPLHHHLPPTTTTNSKNNNNNNINKKKKEEQGRGWDGRGEGEEGCHRDRGGGGGGAGGGGGEGGGGEEEKDMFKDSGTGSHNNNTPSTVCSDSRDVVVAACSNNFSDSNTDEGSGVVPIPVFKSQQYRVCSPAAPPSPSLSLSTTPPYVYTHPHAHTSSKYPHSYSHQQHPHSHHHHHHPQSNLQPQSQHVKLKRITSSASARASSCTRYPSHFLDSSDGSQLCASAVAGGRRHSWCCPYDVPEAKQYRTQSTQTFRHDSASSCSGGDGGESYTDDDLIKLEDTKQEDSKLEEGAKNLDTRMDTERHGKQWTRGRGSKDLDGNWDTHEANQWNSHGDLKDQDVTTRGDSEEVRWSARALSNDPHCLIYKGSNFLLPSHAMLHPDKKGFYHHDNRALHHDNKGLSHHDNKGIHHHDKKGVCGGGCANHDNSHSTGSSSSCSPQTVHHSSENYIHRTSRNNTSLSHEGNHTVCNVDQSTRNVDTNDTSWNARHNNNSPRSTCGGGQVSRSTCMGEGEHEDDPVFIVAEEATRLRTASEGCDREPNGGLTCEDYTLRHRDWREVF